MKQIQQAYSQLTTLHLQGLDNVSEALACPCRPCHINEFKMLTGR